MEVKAMHNATKRDLFNAQANSISFKDAVGHEITVAGIILATDINAEGKEETLTFIIEKGGTIYGGNSATVYKEADTLIDYMEDIEGTGEEVVLVPKLNKSKKGNEFVTLRMI